MNTFAMKTRLPESGGFLPGFLGLAQKKPWEGGGGGERPNDEVNSLALREW